MLGVSPANNILTIQPTGKTQESRQPSVEVEFSPSHFIRVVPFSLSLVECSEMETYQLTLEAW
jgi:hypothetical protein